MQRNCVHVLACAAGRQAMVLRMGGLSTLNRRCIEPSPLLDSSLSLMVSDTSHKILTPVEHVTMYLQVCVVIVPVNLNKVEGLHSSEEPKEISTRDYLHLPGEHDLVILVQLNSKQILTFL